MSTLARTRTSSSRGRASARARRAAARRRLAFLVAAVALIAAGVGTLLPTVDQAVQEVTLPLRHEDIIRQQAADKDLDPSLIAAVIYAESHFRDQTSHAGARGLMQVTPETAREIANRSGGTAFTEADLATPQVNISYGSWYLRWLLRHYGGNETLAVAAYNAGTGNVDKWIARDPDLRPEDIPFPETRHYVAKVLDARADYRREYRSELGL